MRLSRHYRKCTRHESEYEKYMKAHVCSIFMRKFVFVCPLLVTASRKLSISRHVAEVIDATASEQVCISVTKKLQ